MTKKTLNIGIIGSKFMGKAHSNAFKGVQMFFNADASIALKAICGRDETSLREAMEKFGWQECETDWRRLVSRSDVDIIDISAPGYLHKDIAIAAASEGKHIFCEKPLANSLSDAREMAAAVKRAGVTHQIGFNYRFAPAVMLAKKLIDDGKLGTIYHFRARYLQDFIMHPDYPLVWRLQKELAGSGALGDIGSHIIDLSRFLVGDIKEVSALKKTFITKRPLEGTEGAQMGDVTVDDATLFFAEFENGAIGSFEATRFANGNRNGMSFEVNGSKGSVKFEFERMNELKYMSGEDNCGEQGFRLIQATEAVHPYVHAWWPAGHGLGYEHTFVHEMYELVNAVANNTPATPDFEDGVKCAQVVEAIERSCESGRRVLVADC